MIGLKISNPTRPRLARILLVNDDGIDAEGIKVAEELATQFADEIWVVAPQIDQSGMSHALSLHMPIRVNQQGERRFAVLGTPSDCIVMAMKSIMVGKLPDLVISGVNRGSNLADDITYSGTVSGATTASICGLPAVALSQAYRNAGPVEWDTARRYGARLFERLLTEPLPADLCLNVNFPAAEPDSVTGMRATRQGKRTIRSMDVDARIDLRGKPYYWLDVDRASGAQDPDSDIAALRDKAVSVTPLRFDRTDDSALPMVAQRLAAN